MGKIDIDKKMTYILKLEGLKGWKVRWNTGGGLCNYNTKEIWLGKKSQFPFSLFLHEVAHALCPKEKCGRCWVDVNKCWSAHNNGHNVIWGDCYTGLVKKYMKPFWEYKKVFRVAGLKEGK